MATVNENPNEENLQLQIDLNEKDLRYIAEYTTDDYERQVKEAQIIRNKHINEEKARKARKFLNLNIVDVRALKNRLGAQSLVFN